MTHPEPHNRTSSGQGQGRAQPRMTHGRIRLRMVGHRRVLPRLRRRRTVLAGILPRMVIRRTVRRN